MVPRGGEQPAFFLISSARASRDSFVAPYGDHYKIRITAPPARGQANYHLIRFLAKAFGTSRSQISLESGKNARFKRLKIQSPSRIPISRDSSKQPLKLNVPPLTRPLVPNLVPPIPKT
ncbi:MAG: YggU family protein [Gammaproteobacteria bacterium]|nr:YggU family protein [Gammaproteobacteria bacterium]